MSQRTQFTIQLITDAGQAIANAPVLVINRATNNLVVPYVDEFSANYVPNLETNVNGIAQAWLPIGPYQATATSPFLTTPYVQSFDIVPYSSVTVSGSGAGGLAILNILGQVSAGGALTTGAHTPVNAAGAPITMTLPVGASLGTLISVEKFDSSTNIVSVTGNVRETAAQTVQLKLAHETVLFEASSTGSWWPIGGNKPLTALDARYLQTANNFSDLASAATARANLGLGSAAQQNTSAFDAAGVSAAETTRALAAEALLAPLASPALTGIPTGPTAAPGTSTTQLATTAFVQSVASGVTSVFGRVGVVTAQAGDYTFSQVTGAAPLANPAFTGIPTTPTAAPKNSSLQLASTAYVDAADAAQHINPTYSGLVTASGYAATGVTGTVSGRWLGATTSGTPGAGQFAAGDFVVDKSGTFRIFTTAGSWVTPYGVGGTGGGSSTLSSRTYAGTTDVLQSGDANNVIEATGASASTETIPPNSVVNFPVDTIIELFQYGLGQVTVVGSGVNTITAAQSGDGGFNAVASGSPSTVLPSNATAGNTIVLAINVTGAAAPSPDVTSVTGLGGTWNRITFVTVGSGPIELWAANNITGGSRTVTVTCGGGNAYLAQATEFRNVASIISGGTANGTSASASLTVAAQTNNAVVVGAAGNSVFTAGPTAPWVDYNTGGWAWSNFCDTAYQILTNANTVTATWSLSSNVWGAMAVVLIPTSLVTIRSANSLVHTRTQYSTISLRQRALNEWVIAGDTA